MKNKIKISPLAIVGVALSLVLSITLPLIFRGSSNTLIGNESVTAYLSEAEQIPKFDTDMFSTVEYCFNIYYYKALEDWQTLGQKTVDAYLEFREEDSGSLSEYDVTLFLIDCFIYAIGDRYSFYRTPDENDDYMSDMSGSFVGIGVSVTYNTLENTILVTGVEETSPANDAGITAEDYIVAIDGVRVTDIGAAAAMDRIKGEEGTNVKITVLRGEEEITLDITRAKITETTVSHKIIEGGKIGYIKISGFKANTAEQFKLSLDAVTEAGVEAVIFDLRSNPGGYLSAATAMLSYLVPTGTPIASFSSDRKPIYASHGTNLEPTDNALELPSVVLCNSSSASAAELFTSAMRDYNDMELLKSTVIGEVTFKKGIMQSTVPFNDGSTLTLTTALYNPPLGKNLHEVGITPDILLPDDATDEDYMSEAIAVLKQNINQSE